MGDPVLRDDKFVVLRAAGAEDRNYILATWLNCFFLSRIARMMDRPLYFFEQKRVILRLLERSSTVVAANPEEPSQIFGFIVGEAPQDLPAVSETVRAAIVHYCYVNSLYRENGLGRRLVRELVGDASKIFFTHLPPIDVPASANGRKPITPGELVQRVAPGALFDPYLAFPR